MTKEEVFQVLEKTIKHISSNFCAEYGEEELQEYLFPVRASLPFQYSIDSGISKAVILIQGVPFVIKIPFYQFYDNDSYEEDYHYWMQELEEQKEEFAQKRRIETNNENYILTQAELDNIYELYSQEVLEPFYGDERYFYDLEGASCINLGPDVEPAIPDWDYCRLESVIYQLAVEEGLGAYFAEEQYLGTIDNTPVYYQTRCIPLSECSIDYNSKDYIQKRTMSRTACKKIDMYCFNEIWIADFIQQYGEAELKRLHDFLIKYEIDDLRPSNIGYLDGAPILFDYAGYRSW